MTDLISRDAAIAGDNVGMAMIADKPPTEEEVLAAIDAAAGRIDPSDLITALKGDHSFDNVIEALQRAIEREKIAVDQNGMVIALAPIAQAAPFRP